MALAYVDMSSVIEAQVRFHKLNYILLGCSSTMMQHSIDRRTSNIDVDAAIKLNFFSRLFMWCVCATTEQNGTHQHGKHDVNMKNYFYYVFVRKLFIYSCAFYHLR